MMKKLFAILLSIMTAIAVLSGCGAQEVSKTSQGGKLSVVATIFPAYDFARQVCGEYAEVTMLLPPGSESHSFEPTPRDIITIQNADLFIYVGGESDNWAGDILDSMETPVKSLKMMECVNAVEEEIVEGMEAEEEEEEENGHSAAEYDEHVWTSPKNAIKILNAIRDSVKQIDPQNGGSYDTSTSAYADKLQDLDTRFAAFFDTVENKTLVFGDRFPFRYFADEYGLNYYAAYPGCSTESEPGAATIAFLIDKVKAEKIPSVFYIEFSNHRAADSIAESTGAKAALLHSCHNVSRKDMESGVTYLSLMEQNLATLKDAMAARPDGR